MGCLTRGLHALQVDHSVTVIPGPKGPGGRGAVVRVDKDALQALIRDLGTTSRACTAQLLTLLTPETP